MNHHHINTSSHQNYLLNINLGYNNKENKEQTPKRLSEGNIQKKYKYSNTVSKSEYILLKSIREKRRNLLNDIYEKMKDVSEEVNNKIEEICHDIILNRRESMIH